MIIVKFCKKLPLSPSDSFEAVFCRGTVLRLEIFSLELTEIDRLLGLPLEILDYTI